MENQDKPKHICRRCGRKLKSDESKALGFGPTCYKRFMEETKLIPLFVMNTKESADENTE